MANKQEYGKPYFSGVPIRTDEGDVPNPYAHTPYRYTNAVTQALAQDPRKASLWDAVAKERAKRGYNTGNFGEANIDAMPPEYYANGVADLNGYWAPGRREIGLNYNSTEVARHEEQHRAQTLAPLDRELAAQRDTLWAELSLFPKFQYSTSRRGSPEEAEARFSEEAPMGVKFGDVGADQGAVRDSLESVATGQYLPKESFLKSNTAEARDMFDETQSRKWKGHIEDKVAPLDIDDGTRARLVEDMTRRLQYINAKTVLDPERRNPAPLGEYTAYSHFGDMLGSDNHELGVNPILDNIENADNEDYWQSKLPLEQSLEYAFEVMPDRKDEGLSIAGLKKAQSAIKKFNKKRKKK